MAATFKVDVKPSVLVWARTSAGLRRDESARKVGVDEDRIAEWEEGREQPSLAQLRKLGEAYRRPLSVFLLDAPPSDGQAIKDFRNADRSGSFSGALRLALREARERRDIAAELVTSEDADVATFALTASISEDPETVAARIRSALGVSLEEQRAFGSGALARWRVAIESLGVLVFGFASVEVDEARGFALTEGAMPAIGLNNQDSPNARSFTLMHELTHVALRAGDALCDVVAETSDATEVFCNHVAGAVLVPRTALLSAPEVSRSVGRQSWDDTEIRALASRFSVSREVVLRRLLIADRMSARHYGEWRARLNAEHAGSTKKRQKGGPSYPTKMASQLGKLYTHLVLAAHTREAITSSAASSYLGVKIDHFAELARATAIGAA